MEHDAKTCKMFGNRQGLNLRTLVEAIYAVTQLSMCTEAARPNLYLAENEGPSRKRFALSFVMCSNFPIMGDF